MKEYPEGINVHDEVTKFIGMTGISVTKKGDEYLLKSCPFCKGGENRDRNTFSINYRTGQYQCKRSKCNAKGNLWTLTKDENFDYALPEPEKKEIRKHTHKFKINPCRDERAAAWIRENRCIPEEITYKYKVMFGTERFKEIKNADHNMILAKPDKFLVWQFTNAAGDRVLWYKFRRTEGEGAKEWSISKHFLINDVRYHVEPCLFGMGECDYKEPYVIMTEGQFDTLAVAAAGFGNVVSVPTGQNGFTWFDENEESKNFLNRFETLIIFGDKENDKITLLKEMQERFNGKIKCVRAEDYKDCKDANDILRKYGVDQIRACVNNAEMTPIKGLKKMKDVKKVNMTNLSRIKTGIPTLDKYLLGFFFGQVITLTGRSGEGKTTLSSQMISFALEQNVPTVIYSGEFPEWMIKNWLVLQIAGPDNLEVSATGVDVKKDVWDRIDAWEPFGENCHIYSVDVDLNENEEDCVEMLDTIKQAILQAGVRMIVIDNLMTAMEFSEESDLNKAQSSFMKKLKKIALTYEVIILVIAHPKKTSRIAGAKEIGKEDIAGSSNIGNLSDTIISYSKPVDSNASCDREIRVLKNRWNNDFGVDKVIETYFNDASKRIAESKVFDWTFGWQNTAEEEDENKLYLGF